MSLGYHNIFMIDRLGHRKTAGRVRPRTLQSIAEFGIFVGEPDKAAFTGKVFTVTRE